jgi:hypothetical protein
MMTLEEASPMKVLSKTESFQLLRRRFEELKPLDVIELCDKGRRFRAVVAEKVSDGFFVVELTDSILSDVVYGPRALGPPPRIEVVVPDDPNVQHPMWNVLRR